MPKCTAVASKEVAAPLTAWVWSASQEQRDSF